MRSTQWLALILSISAVNGMALPESDHGDLIARDLTDSAENMIMVKRGDQDDKKKKRDAQTGPGVFRDDRPDCAKKEGGWKNCPKGGGGGVLGWRLLWQE